MSTINERFREVREYLNLSQDEFATKANRTRSEIKNIEYNKTSPKEEVIKAVCAAHNINRKFLELGEEPKIITEPDDDSAYISELLNAVDDPVVDIIKAFMSVYVTLNEEDKKKARAFAASLKNKVKESRD
ncbi:MAG: helix-turn-helix transcriptional regulator [Oscillospiraceae bacterium]|jgi:transcriptional regulator with XRE-family HTH domain|nr:helix-turn-helix transcriptional regulator [Oscillospiraceae bacterium]